MISLRLNVMRVNYIKLRFLVTVKTMKDIAPTRTAVCPLWGSKGLLVRFRGTPQDDREAVAAQKPGKKPSGHEDNDKKVSRSPVQVM